MVEGSPRRIAVTSQETNIKNLLELAEDKNPLTFKSHDAGDSDPSDSPPAGSRWKKLRTTVQLGNAVVAHHRRPPLKREDSFLKRFSTRPPAPRPLASEALHRSALRCAPVLNPDESPLVVWLWLVTLCGLYNSWALIARQAFPELQEAAPWWAMDAASDVVYCLDVLVQFRTGYLEQGIMVREGVRLARHYVASKDFFLDVAALLPLGHFLQGVLGDSPLLRFPRFLKARRIYKFYYAVESRTAYPNLWRVANLIHVLLLLAHWFGCFYYMLSELEGFQGNWAYKHGEHSPLTRKYLGSVYWSTLTLTTIGDLATPATNLQYLFTIISYLIGVFIFATIVGQVGNVITNRNASRLEFERLLDGAKLYMRHHRVPKGMQRRVQRWYDYSWSRGRMQGGGDIHSALGILPDKLKTELAIHVNLKTLKKVSIFQECQPEFLHDLVLKMKAYIFTPGDLVCRKGEVAREMFIIADGILQVINEKGQVLTHMRAGDFFGEIGILNLDGFNRRTADVRSVGYSELFSLSREDVLSAMKDYPEAEEILQTMGRRRLLEARLNNASDKSQDDSDSGRGKNENRQRKKGISLSHLLRKKETPHDFNNFLPKYNANKNPPSQKDTPLQNNALFNHVKADPKAVPPADDTAPRVAYLMEQITSKLRRRGRLRITKKHTWWYRISSLVHLRGRAPVASPPVPPPQEEEPRPVGVASKPPEELRIPLPSDRRTSWQPSKPSISNWTRSELFTHSADPSSLVPNQRRTAEVGVIDTPPDVSPMSSNYSLTPSTTEEEGGDGPGGGNASKKSSLPQKLSTSEGGELPPELRQVVQGLVMGIKDKVDELIVKTEKKTVDEILQLRERIKQQDAIIEFLEMRCAKLDEEAAEKEDRRPSSSSSAPKSSPLNKPSEDSAVSSMDIASPVDLITDVKFEEEDMWLVEFPTNLPAPIPAAAKDRRSKLRRHSSVEVGHELPFRLASRPAENFLQSTPFHSEDPVSPRRFSESHVRSGAIPLNKSFAAKVRRVLAKVRVNRDTEEPDPFQSAYQWPPAADQGRRQSRRSSTGSVPPPRVQEVRCGSDGRPKRPLLPTITESGSFDSLRESPLLPPHIQPASMPNLEQVSIDVE